jgi:DNA-binding response OmpR family regulator
VEDVDLMEPPRILVIEDDPRVGSSLLRGLKLAGFRPELVCDGRVGLEQVLVGGWELIVLDLRLPELHGLDVLRESAGRTSTPVIVLTADTDLSSRLETFALGAVDYVPKPFFIEELVARIRTRVGVPPPTRELRFGGVVVCLDTREVTRGGLLLDLTTHEYNLLAWLAERPGRPVSRRQLVEGALPFESSALDRTVDSHIARIRKKLGSDGECIETVWRVGYRFTPELAVDPP